MVNDNNIKESDIPPVAESSKQIMPDLYGVELKKVEKLFQRLGININQLSYSEANMPNYRVLTQSIKPGTELEGGEKIDLTISSINPIKFLPSIFQSSDSKNDDFLKRYLWIFQHIFNSLNYKLDYIHEYFNPMEASPEFFNWLASWFSININYSLPEDKMRLLVKEAVNLYQWRGTKAGIAKYLEIVTGVKPDILENYIPIEEYVVVDNKLVERPITMEETSKYFFTVSFPVSSNYFDIVTMLQINKIIKAEKPAYSSFYIVFSGKKEERRGGFTVGTDSIGGDLII